MSNSYIESINGFLKSNPKHRLIFFDKLEGINSLDLGFAFARELLQLEDNVKFSFKAKDILDELCVSHTEQHDSFGKCLCLKNLGILFHSELKLDLNAFLKKHSITSVLFIEWTGESNSDFLYFLSKGNGQKVPIGDITHLNLTER
jgi:hypothetical protein